MSTYAVDREKWAAMSVFDQLGNIGSEVGRSLNAKRRGDEKSAEAAESRALDLFDATYEAWLVSSPPRIKELQLSKQQYLNAYNSPNYDNGIENYFMQFAIAARLNR